MVDSISDRLVEKARAILPRVDRDIIVHEVRGTMHRLVLNGDEGAWVSSMQIARIGIYAAAHPRHDGNLPRVFVPLDVQAAAATVDSGS